MNAFQEAAGFAFEDAQLRRLHYHLLRLTVVGLTRPDVAELGDLGRLVFTDADYAGQVAAIRGRADASPLASAIAEIMETAASGVGGPARPAAVLLGAVLGAHAGFGFEQPDERARAAIAGAVGGAVAGSVGELVQRTIEEIGAPEYTRVDD